MLRGRGPNVYEAHHGGGDAHPFGILLLLLLVAAIVAIVILFVQTRRLTAVAANAPTSTASSVDPAVAELRLRYARGDIDRAQFLERAVDLGDTSVGRDTASP